MEQKPVRLKLKLVWSVLLSLFAIIATNRLFRVEKLNGPNLCYPHRQHHHQQHRHHPYYCEPPPSFVATSAQPQFSLDDTSAEELSTLLAQGRLTSVQLVRAYFDRTVETHTALHAVSELNPDALDIARALDHERALGVVRGPLHGIPVLIKDNIATADRLNTTCGSYALLGATVTSDAPVIAALRDAGAIILGKATMGEWAQFRSSRATGSHGWSAFGGQPRGAWYPQQDPHGSSSGSAIAVSAGLAPVSLATETSGSIVNPAERNNLVGIKPTLGLTSRHMVIPISVRQDTVGPIAKTVRDAAAVLGVIAGRDTNDNYTAAQPWADGQVPDYVAACDPFGLKGARIGVPRNAINEHLEPHLWPVMDAFEATLRDFVRGGASIVDHADYVKYEPPAFHRAESVVLSTDFADGLEKYFASLSYNPNEIHDLAGLREFSHNDPREAYPDRDTYVWDRTLNRSSSSGGGVPITPESDESRAAHAANEHMATTLGVDGALDFHGLDALIMPTFAAFQLPAVGGLPLITVPLGFYPDDAPLRRNAKGSMFDVTPGMPFGISFVGRKWSESTLIRLAYAFEQRTRVQGRRGTWVRAKTDVRLQDQVVVAAGAATKDEETAREVEVQAEMQRDVTHVDHHHHHHHHHHVWQDLHVPIENGTHTLFVSRMLATGTGLPVSSAFAHLNHEVEHELDVEVDLALVGGLVGLS